MWALLLERKPALMGMQELRLAKEHQRSFQRRMMACGYRTTFGVPTPWGKDKESRMRLVHVEVPGMGFFSQEGVHATPKPLLTARPKRLTVRADSR